MHPSAVLLLCCVDRVRRRLNTHGYKWDLSVRPPTPTLDRLTEYLQVRGDRGAGEGGKGGREEREGVAQQVRGDRGEEGRWGQEGLRRKGLHTHDCARQAH